MDLKIIELIASILAILYVLMAARQQIWCWGAALISSLLYIYICFSTHLFAQTFLHMFFMIMAIYGIYSWNKKNENTDIIQWNIKTHLLILFVGSIIVFLAGFYLTHFTSSKMAIIDSFTTFFSLIATYMVTKKVLENWIYWIAIDLTSVFLYDSRDLQITAILYIIYTGIAIYGYFNWIKLVQKND